MNKWNISLKDLPSEGIFYNSDAFIRIHPLTVSDCKYLCTLDQGNIQQTTAILNEVLRGCITTNIEFNDLICADRDWLIFWLRVNSFINTNGYNVMINCPKCGDPISKEIKLSNLNIKYISQCEKVTKTVNFSGDELTITGFTPRLKDKRYTIESDKEIEDILNYTNIREYFDFEQVDPVWLIDRLEALEYVKMRTIAKASKFGIDELVKFTHQPCGQEINVQLDLSDKNIFGRISLYDILKTQIQVSKYCGFQISDDLCFTEVEILQEVIKQLIEEENAASEEQKSKITSLGRLNIQNMR